MTDDLWPEDVLTNEEWERGWFDREVIAGRRKEEDRIEHPAEFGGTAPEETPWHT